jgi:macrophage erythroblast attacher
LPYAHHTKSHVENDPVILPNGRVYGRERLMVGSRGGVGGGVGEGKVRDPTTGEVYSESEVRKVFIS